jgi:hypothetical protein
MRSSSVALALVFAGPFLLCLNAQGTAAISGQWMIDGESTPEQVHLTLHRRMGQSGSSTNSSSFLLGNLRGLTKKQMDSVDGSVVHFQIIRDAGTLACEGYFKRGDGAGSFAFSPNPNFASEMRTFGYQGLTPEMHYSMAAHDVSLAYVRDLRSLNAAPASADGLIAMRIHGVSIDYIKELKSLGYDNLKPNQLVTMRIHGVTTEFIHELKKLGYSLVSSNELVTMRIHGATTEFISQLESLGYSRPSINQLVTMRIHGATTDFITQLKSLGYTHPAIDQLVTMRIHGVTPDYIQKLRSRGMKNLSIDQMVNLRIHGIVD